MKNLKNKNGFTLVELLAVIVVLAIVMGIAAVAITNVLDSTRKNAFVASAKQYIAGAKTLVNTDLVEVMMGSTTNKYAPKCGTTETTKTIAIMDIPTEGMANDKSPFGTGWDRANSYVLVKATPKEGTTDCTYSYHIYLSDTVYSIGSNGGEIAESALDSSKVLPIQSGS